ncbi:MAG: metal ABC transporter ATP-binding protein [Eubacteriales bacterium]|nr:metal ABC transporter ATP-binding protein [Eubacteriales bacterium]
MSEVIKIRGLDFSYTEDPVLKNLDLSLKRGQLMVLVGENGSGKSTLLKLLLGELKAEAGTIEVLGEDISKLRDYRKIGYVPQMNVVQKIAFPITCIELLSIAQYRELGFIKIPGKKHKLKASEILTQLGLKSYRNVPFNELSGGLQQRVMIARALIEDPEIIILDEPTAGIDQDSKEQFFQLIRDLNQERKLSMILVTHEIEMVTEKLGINQIYKIAKGAIENVRV